MQTIKTYFKGTFLYKPLSIIKNLLINYNLVLASLLFKFCKIQNNKIVFASMLEKQFSLQPKMIYDELIKAIPNGLDIVWLLPDDVPCPKGARKVQSKSVKSIYELCTAKIWIDNARKDMWIHKRKKQFYIQTWHGPICLKAVENDCKTTLPPSYVLAAKIDSKNADYLVAETKWRADNIYSSFWYNGPLIKGEFKKEAYIEAEKSRKNVRQYFNINSNEKIALYIPTFRKDDCTDYYSLDYVKILNHLEKINNEKYRFIVRLHPNISQKQNDLLYSENVLNGTNYPSVDELIVSADIVFSDYSGCIFQSYRANKPVFIFATDIDSYIKEDRALYFDIFKLPSPVAKTNEELLANIDSFNQEEYEKKRIEFVDSVGFYEPDATILAVDKIMCTLKEKTK